MPRPRHPSDLARLKTPPHIKVHLDVSANEATAEAWANPEMRGMLVELWRLAGEKWAGRNGDEVVLSRSALASCAGRTQHAHNLRAMRALCVRVGYALRERGALVVIHIPKFAKNQGYGSALSGATPPPPPASEADSEADSEEKKEEKSKSPPEAADPHEISPPGTLWRMLKGAKDDEREAWLHHTWSGIYFAAESECPEPSKLSAWRKKIMFGRWGKYLENPSPRKFEGIAAERAQQAKRDAAELKFGAANAAAEREDAAERERHQQRRLIG